MQAERERNEAVEKITEGLISGCADESDGDKGDGPASKVAKLSGADVVQPLVAKKPAAALVPGKVPDNPTLIQVLEANQNIFKFPKIVAQLKNEAAGPSAEGCKCLFEVSRRLHFYQQGKGAASIQTYR